jgi:TRAP-type C4-dicarboxylate transport system permease small subunit
MQKLRELLEPVALGILLIGGLGMLLSTFLGAADVIGTQVFGQPIHGALEITESTMVVIVFGALTYAQIRRNHIRVELFYTRVSPRAQAAMDVFAHAMAVLFFGLLLWQAVNEAIISVGIDESTFGLIRFPLWPARIILAAGTALLILQLVLDLIGDVQRFFRGGDPEVTESLMQREIDAVEALIQRDES